MVSCSEDYKLQIRLRKFPLLWGPLHSRQRALRLVNSKLTKQDLEELSIILSNENQHFIKPPYKHNHNDIATLIFRLIEINEILDVGTKLSFKAFYIATSIAYTLLRRERELYREFVETRNIRATSLCSGYLKVNIERRIQAECFYFEDKVMLDWRYKAFHLQF